MRQTRFALVAAVLCAAVVPLAAQSPAPPAGASAPDPMGHKQLTPSKGLTISIYHKVNNTENRSITTLTLMQIAALPHKTVTVYNLHEKKNETYSGVPLADLLTANGAPFNKDTQHNMLNSVLIVHGTDGYTVTYSTVEVYTPDYHTGDVIVADTLDGKLLNDDGLKLVSSEDKHPMRWVHSLDKVTLVMFSQPSPPATPAPAHTP